MQFRSEHWGAIEKSLSRIGILKGSLPLGGWVLREIFEIPELSKVS